MIAPSIQVAEAAKLLENVQRDVNIALMNEVSIFCDALDISVRDVIDVAASKPNFLPLLSRACWRTLRWR